MDLQSLWLIIIWNRCMSEGLKQYLMGSNIYPTGKLNYPKCCKRQYSMVIKLCAQAPPHSSILKATIPYASAKRFAE